MADFRTRKNHSRKIEKLYQHKHLSALIHEDVSINLPIAPVKAPYENEELCRLRDRLNETKSKMDKFYIGSKTDPQLARNWTSLQSAVDLYRPMRYYIAEQFNAQIVTNAWMKYYEIYSQYNLIPATSERPYRAFFNAELPGAALCAFNHYMKTMRPGMEFDWRASSIAPDTANTNNTDVLGDNYGLWDMNRDKWLMQLKDESADRNDGDATKLTNLEDWAAKIGPTSEFGGMDLYSHDAGIDVSGGDGANTLGFNRQEEANAKIHLGCALAGFMTLRPGGIFIAKQYTYFETLTWNLILIYSTLFESFHICKPLTSRPYNSEVYLVGIGFKGLPPTVKTALVNKLNNFDMKPLLPKESLGTVLSQPYSELLRMARVIFGQQIQFIEENLRLFDQYGGNVRTLSSGIEYLKIDRRNAWIKQYPMRAIDTRDYLPAKQRG